MTDLPTALTVMTGLIPWVGDRGMSTEARADMLRNNAVAFVTLARTDEELAILISHAWEDTKLASLIVGGHCDRMPKKGERCDHGKARGVLSIHPWCKQMLRYADGSPESMLEETRCALRIIRDGKERCRDSALSPAAGAFAALAARPCTWAGAEKRTKTYRRVLSSLRRSSAGGKR